MLSTALVDDPTARRQLRDVPDAIAAALDLEDGIDSAAREQAGMPACRGYWAAAFNYSTALEWSLKLKELTYVLADAYSTADFEHGPIAMIDPGFDRSRPSSRRADPARDRSSSGGGSEKLALGSSLPPTRPRRSPMRTYHSGCRRAPEWLSPLSAIIPGQLFAYHLALAKQIDPDHPRHIQKGHQDRVTLRRQAVQPAAASRLGRASSSIRSVPEPPVYSLARRQTRRSELLLGGQPPLPGSGPLIEPAPAGWLGPREVRVASPSARGRFDEIEARLAAATAWPWRLSALRDGVERDGCFGAGRFGF